MIGFSYVTPAGFGLLGQAIEHLSQVDRRAAEPPPRATLSVGADAGGDAARLQHGLGLVVGERRRGPVPTECGGQRERRDHVGDTPAQNAAAMPKKTASTMPRTDAHTEVAPLIPQKNAVGVSRRARSRSACRSRTACPSSNASGTRSATAVSDAHGRGCASRARGCTARLNPARTARGRRAARAAVPAATVRRAEPHEASGEHAADAAERSSENSTTVSAYVGWPRKMLRRCSCETSIRRKPSPMPAK